MTKSILCVVLAVIFAGMLAVTVYFEVLIGRMNRVDGTDSTMSSDEINDYIDNETDPDAAIAMLSWLKGTEEFNTSEQAFLKDRLKGKEYKVRSFFSGATQENDYTPSVPYVVAVSENPYSFDNENWATLWVKSSGADSLRSLKFRKKPSTGQWFLNDIQCLSEIRLPTEEDKWA